MCVCVCPLYTTQQSRIYILLRVRYLRFVTVHLDEKCECDTISRTHTRRFHKGRLCCFIIIILNIIIQNVFLVNLNFVLKIYRTTTIIIFLLIFNHSDFKGKVKQFKQSIQLIVMSVLTNFREIYCLVF
jgi:hypothetical protein